MNAVTTDVSAQTTPVEQGESYLDLHVEGVGYLNRAREVEPRKGETYLAVQVAAVHGPLGSGKKLNRTLFDTPVVGKRAQALVRNHWEDINAEDRKVLIGFRLSDLYVETTMAPRVRRPDRSV